MKGLTDGEICNDKKVVALLFEPNVMRLLGEQRREDSPPQAGDSIEEDKT